LALSADRLRSELEAFLAEFAYRIDRGDPQTVADLFTPNGQYIWEGHGASAGRDAIRATYARRSSLGVRTARHLFTNLRFERSGAQVVATSILLLFAENGPPPHPAIPLLLADVDDIFVQLEGRWLLTSRRLTDIFVDSRRSPVLPLDNARG
jgi:hypothetical protein